MNGLLCIGGPADGQYHSVADELCRHGEIIQIAVRLEASLAFSRFVGSLEAGGTVEQYKVWQWFQGGFDGGRTLQRRRLYLIPVQWDGFEAMDWVERKAYGEDRD